MSNKKLHQNKQVPSSATGDPFFHDTFSLVQHLFLDLREQACEECGWSVPTFYRKLRNSLIKRNIMSNAESEKVYTVTIALLEGAILKINQTTIARKVMSKKAF